jgi:peptidoglycan/xylan/chitin deacetylase (PgdA/CDA1 family)
MSEFPTSNRSLYTFDEYERLLQSLREDGFDFTDFSSLENDQVAVRHDVDLLPGRALEMAMIEARNDVETTYCFLLTTPIYNLLDAELLRTLEEIRALGHEIALHFDTHHYWSDRPSVDELRSRIDDERAILGRLLGAEITTVSFHVPPEWVLGTEFDGFISTYQPEFFTDATYRSDSSQKWRSEPPLPDERPDRLQLLVHPGLWSESGRELNDIAEKLAEARHADVDAYFEPIGT